MVVPLDHTPPRPVSRLPLPPPLQPLAHTRSAGGVVTGPMAESAHALYLDKKYAAAIKAYGALATPTGGHWGGGGGPPSGTALCILCILFAQSRARGLEKRIHPPKYRSPQLPRPLPNRDPPWSFELRGKHGGYESKTTHPRDSYVVDG